MSTIKKAAKRPLIVLGLIAKAGPSTKAGPSAKAKKYIKAFRLFLRVIFWINMLSKIRLCALWG